MRRQSIFLMVILFGVLGLITGCSQINAEDVDEIVVQESNKEERVITEFDQIERVVTITEEIEWRKSMPSWARDEDVTFWMKGEGIDKTKFSCLV
ncbi:hypothetical protein IC620_11945 [Hazenella sp. IB182357]|uniref:Uncharacterized protein n=1 Tax=Polycladospora coralii TaxID=2771432 RepID=A0A926RTP5_9BACL|nr:hypothetical protein [Polycladospora coralii]MBD1373065.1 hypothetical protein [Polycladospora coralii]